MRSLEEIKRDNGDTRCHLEDDGRRCTKTRGHGGTCKFIGRKHSAELARAREVIASYGERDTIVVTVSPEVRRDLDRLRDTGYFGGADPTVESVAQELIYLALRQNRDFVK